MATVVIFDKSTNDVLEIKLSVHTPDYASRTDVIINPDLESLSDVSIEHLTHKGGSIVEMTTEEKDSKDAKIIQNDKDIRIAEIDVLDISLSDLIQALISQGIVTDFGLKSTIKTNNGL